MLWSKVKLNTETWDEDAEAIEMEQERAGWVTIIGLEKIKCGTLSGHGLVGTEGMAREKKLPGASEEDSLREMPVLGQPGPAAQGQLLVA